MGLDMYLYAEKYMGSNTDKTGSYAEIKNLAGLKDLLAQSKRYSWLDC
jgi:hypothetical protein